MPDASPIQCFTTEEPQFPHYSSYILRCWTSAAGQMRVRLIDVRSDVSYPVVDWTELPELVRRLAETDLAGRKD